jgi:hypothetical protein
LQRKVAGVDKGTVQDAQQSGLNNSGCGVQNGIPSRHNLNLGERHRSGLAWRSQSLHFNGRDSGPSGWRGETSFQGRVVSPGRHGSTDRRFGRVQLVWANVDELVRLSLGYQPSREQPQTIRSSPAAAPAW